MRAFMQAVACKLARASLHSRGREGVEHEVGGGAAGRGLGPPGHVHLVGIHVVEREEGAPGDLQRAVLVCRGFGRERFRLGLADSLVGADC